MGVCAPCAQTHPQGVCENGAPRNPLGCNTRLKHLKFNFIFQHFLWKVETDGPDKGTVMCLTLTRGEETKAAIPTLVFDFAFLEDVPALQYLFKNFNKPMDISWLLA